MGKETLILTQGDLQGLVTMREVVETVEKVFKGHGQGRVVMPPKMTLDLGETGNWPNYRAGINAMPAYVGALDVAGIKWAGVFQQNAEKGLPSVVATIILNDPHTGLVLSVMEGAWITALRTGAATAVGAKYLAQAGADTVAIIGAGTQGRYQLRALASVFTLKEVKVYDIRKEASTSYVEEMSQELDLHIRPQTNLKDAVTGADIVVTCTMTREPFLNGEWLGAGSFVSALGSFEEIYDNVVLQADKIVVDNLAQSQHRGSLAKKFERSVLKVEDVYGELGDIVAATKVGRANDKEKILLEPVGMGSEDIAVASLLYQRAQERGIGLKVDFLE